MSIAARNWINSCPQTAATTFAFSSVFILLLWPESTFKILEQASLWRVYVRVLVQCTHLRVRLSLTSQVGRLGWPEPGGPARASCSCPARARSDKRRLPACPPHPRPHSPGRRSSWCSPSCWPVSSPPPWPRPPPRLTGWRGRSAGCRKSAAAVLWRQEGGRLWLGNG